MAFDLEGLKAFLTYILTPSAPVFTAGFIIVCLFPILLHFILHGRDPKFISPPSVLLLGPSGAGKTALLTLFERNNSTISSEKLTTAPTHTSQAPGTVSLTIPSDPSDNHPPKKFLLIDTPGHAKLRSHALSLLSPTASPESARSKLTSVVFLVDAAALADGDALPSTAAYLYDTLLALQKRMGAGRGSKAPSSIPVLVAANKLDLFTALPAALVKSNLEAELGRIRKTRSKGLLDSGVGADDLAAGEEGDDWLGEYGSEKFSFKQMLEFDIEVDVIGGSTTGDGPGAEKWWKWIAERI
ncbi:signal recognition particle receptor beta subunit-domain-containing protein [Immersiella caudata]|uniref:Signal recognition particle receptor subunit beta n=1 Tax=Immersiella caudata TaxID=314043 RepID=A0AA39WW91_9PEZI|nr:signal recognition particle receptor beta subunit-domain-containing protein [Immersiella caudata]